MSNEFDPKIHAFIDNPNLWHKYFKETPDDILIAGLTHYGKQYHYDDEEKRPIDYAIKYFKKDLIKYLVEKCYITLTAQHLKYVIEQYLDEDELDMFKFVVKNCKNVFRTMQLNPYIPRDKQLILLKNGYDVKKIGNLVHDINYFNFVSTNRDFEHIIKCSSSKYIQQNLPKDYQNSETVRILFKYNKDITIFDIEKFNMNEVKFYEIDFASIDNNAYILYKNMSSLYVNEHLLNENILNFCKNWSSQYLLNFTFLQFMLNEFKDINAKINGKNFIELIATENKKIDMDTNKITILEQFYSQFLKKGLIVDKNMVKEQCNKPELSNVICKSRWNIWGYLPKIW